VNSDFFTARPSWPDQTERIVQLLGRVSAVEQPSGRAPELRRTNRIGSVHSSAAIEGNAYGVSDFLRAHALLTSGLVAESGALRTVYVEIVGTDGSALQTGTRFAKVPRGTGELLEWAERPSDHRPVFTWMPTETLIRAHQDRYYAALQASREPEIDAAPFVDLMLGVVAESLDTYAERALTRVRDVGANVGASVGVRDAIVMLLKAEPPLSATANATRLDKAPRTVERHLAGLKSDGRPRRHGSDKAGHWEVVDR
jgi:Fic family protein